MYVKHKDKKKSNPVVRDKLIFLLVKDPGKSSSNKIINWDEQKVARGKQNCDSCLPKGQLMGKSRIFKPLKHHWIDWAARKCVHEKCGVVKLCVSLFQAFR